MPILPGDADLYDLAKTPFSCPRCTGPYFGRDADSGIIHCHCTASGMTYSRQVGGSPVPHVERPCGWTGTEAEYREQWMQQFAASE